MSESHTIQTATLELEFHDEATATNFQTKAGEFFSKQLMTVVEDVFNELSPDPSIWSIEHLEIDLGTVRGHAYQEDMESLLRTRLSEHLSALLYPGQSPSSSVKHMLPEQWEWQQLQHFLDWGVLLWKAKGQDRQMLERWLRQTLDKQPDVLIQFLKDSVHRPMRLRRLAQQFSDSTLQKLSEVLAPSGLFDIPQQIANALLLGTRSALSPLWTNLMGEQRRLFEEALRFYGRFAPIRKKLSHHLSDPMLRDIVMLLEPLESEFVQEIVNRPQWFQQQSSPTLQPTTELKPRLWEYTLGYLLVERGSEFNRKAYLGGLIRQMAAHHNQHYSELLAELKHSLESLDAPSRVKTAMLHLLGELTEEQTDYEEKEESNPLELSKEALEQQLEIALQEGLESALRPIWSQLTSQHQEWFRERLQHYGRWARVRKRISTNFSDPMLQGIVRVLEPQAVDWVNAIIEHPEIFQQADEVAASEPITAYKKHLWGFTLSYLLVERGSEFNKRAYLGSILQQMAAHENVPYSDLVFAITQTVSNLSLSSAFKQSLLLLLQGLIPQEKSLSEQKSAPIEVHAAEEESYQRLLNVLWHGADSGFGPAFVSKFRKHVEKLHQGSFASLGLLGEQWPETEVEQQRFFAQVLNRLLQEQWQAFNSASAENVLHSTAARLLPTSSPFENLGRESSWNAMPEPRTTKEREQALLSFFEQKFPGGKISQNQVTPQEATQLQHWIEILFQTDPIRLKRVLESTLDALHPIDQLFEWLPETLLIRILLLMRGNDVQKIHPYADAMSRAYQDASMATPGLSVQRLKWRLLFRYLIEEGHVFEATRFVRWFTQSLEPHSHQRSQFHQQLSQQLQKQQRPSTEALTQQIVTVVSQTAEEEVPVSSKKPSSSDRPLEKQTTEEELEALEAAEPLEEIFIHNAGMVLATPYLPRLFEMLHLTKKGEFLDSTRMERAIHVLQYLVNEQCSSPEYELVLNKILCGHQASIPICPGVELHDDERALIDGLLQGLIDNWGALGNTTVSGFRESFLQREGRLQRIEDHWHLLVESQAYDMLLDQIPWNFSMIKHPWMLRLLQVEWR